MPKQSLDGVYMLRMAILDEEDFGPPPPGVEEDLDDVEFEDVGKFQISGDKVIALDGDTDHIEELIQTTFRKEGKKVKTKDGREAFVDYQVPIRNGEPGFAQAFLETLAHFDYWYERQED